MKTIKQVNTTVTRITETKCDVCGKTTEGFNWATEPYQFEFVEVKHAYGTDYPERRSSTNISFDLCPDCFKRLRDFLESIWAKPSITDQDGEPTEE